VYWYFDQKSTKLKVAYRDEGLYVDQHTGKKCVRPTRDNPYMNFTPADHEIRPDRPPACDITDPKVAGLADKYYGRDLFQDVDDVFNRRSNARQFFTTACTEVASDQTGFSQWLYKDQMSANKRAFEADRGI
jgi:hypothetical protein